jgi:hypothetical protein
VVFIDLLLLLPSSIHLIYFLLCPRPPSPLLCHRPPSLLSSTSHSSFNLPPAPSTCLSLNLLVGCDLLAALRFCGQLPSISSISFFVVAPFPPFFVIDLHLRRRQPPAPSLWLSLNLLVGCDSLAVLRFRGRLPGSLLLPSSIFFVVDFFLFPNV